MRFWISCAALWIGSIFLALSGANNYLFFAGFVILQSIVLASAWNILGGYAGYVNFGVPAFIGAGAYAALADKEAAKRLELEDMTTEQQVVAQAVQQTLDGWRGHKSFAWAGECGIFADYAFDKCREKGVEPDVHSFYESLDTESRFTGPPGIPMATLKEWGVSLNHVWLHLKGRFFDASAPNGVSSLIELPSIQIGIYHSMKEKQPEKLDGLVELFPWWREAARQATEFDKVFATRDAYYQEN